MDAKRRQVPRRREDVGRRWVRATECCFGGGRRIAPCRLTRPCARGRGGESAVGIRSSDRLPGASRRRPRMPWCPANWDRISRRRAPPDPSIETPEDFGCGSASTAHAAGTRMDRRFHGMHPAERAAMRPTGEGAWKRPRHAPSGGPLEMEPVRDRQSPSARRGAGAQVSEAIWGRDLLYCADCVLQHEPPESAPETGPDRTVGRRPIDRVGRG